LRINRSIDQLHQPVLPRQGHGHHALLDLPRLGQFPFQRGDFGIHVAQDFGNSSVIPARCVGRSLQV